MTDTLTDALTNTKEYKLAKMRAMTGFYGLEPMAVRLGDNIVSLGTETYISEYNAKAIGLDSLEAARSNLFERGYADAEIVTIAVAIGGHTDTERVIRTNLASGITEGIEDSRDLGAYL